MPFSFTFKLSVPGLSNPFSTGKAPPYHSPGRPTPGSILIDTPAALNPPRRYPQRSSVSKSPPISRKRGWEPAFTQSTPTPPTPRYHQAIEDSYQEVMASDTEMPPPTKRRRGLTGCIVDTAFNAALIGTAVGLTMYRLWRDRGKGPERLPPPPPYQEGEWISEQDKHQRQAASHVSVPTSPPPPISPPPIHVIPTTPRNHRKARHVPGVSSSAGKRSIAHRRTVQRGTISHHPVVHHHQPALSSTSALFPPPQPEFNFEPVDVDDEMDWIGDKLSELIEQGKKALNREVVVMSDAQEDEVDDGSGAWEEEEGRRERDEDRASVRTAVSRSRSGSVKHSTLRRPRSVIGFGFGSSLSLSPPNTRHHRSSTTDLHTPSPSPRKGMTSSASAPTMTPGDGFGMEERGEWESPEIRESMERARAKVLERMRGLGGG